MVVKTDYKGKEHLYLLATLLHIANVVEDKGLKAVVALAFVVELVFGAQRRPRPMVRCSKSGRITAARPPRYPAAVWAGSMSRSIMGVNTPYGADARGFLGE